MSENSRPPNHSLTSEPESHDHLRLTSKQLASVRPGTTVADMLETARLMARHSFCPAHLVWVKDPERTVANCFRIVVQARRWNLDPFTVAEQSYEVGGRLGFSGIIVAAVANNSGMLEDRLTFTQEGTGLDLRITVSGTLKGQTKPLTKTLRAGDMQTKSTMWKSDPQGKLYFSTVRAWVKLYAPELLMGFGDEDELPAIAAGDFDEMTASPTDALADGAGAGCTPKTVPGQESSAGDPATLCLPGTLISIEQARMELGLSRHALREWAEKNLGITQLELINQGDGDAILDLLRRRIILSGKAWPSGVASGDIVPPAAGVQTSASGEAQTLQEALGGQTVIQGGNTNTDATRGLATQEQILHLTGVRDSYYSLIGLGDAKAFAAERKAAWDKIIAKRGVTSAKQLTQLQCDDLIKSLEAAVTKLADAQRAAGITCTSREQTPATLPPSSSKS